MTGVYIIRCTKNNMVYVGSSRDVGNRIGTHISALNSKKHHNKPMQRDFKRYGAKAFIWQVAEECAAGELLEVERRHIDLHRPSVYNIMQPSGPAKYSGKGFITLRVAMKLGKESHEFLLNEQRRTGEAMSTVLRGCIKSAMDSKSISSNLG